MGLIDGLSGEAETLILLRISALGKTALLCSSEDTVSAFCPGIAWRHVPFRFFCDVDPKPFLLYLPFNLDDVWSAEGIEFFEPLEEEFCEVGLLDVRGLLMVSMEDKLRLLPVTV